MPRRPLYSEKKFASINVNGEIQEEQELPCWQDTWYGEKKATKREGDPSETGIAIEEAEIFMSLVVPAFNEEARLKVMLVEAVNYLQENYAKTNRAVPLNGSAEKGPRSAMTGSNGSASATQKMRSGWEVLVVSDGSTDKTVDIALQCARDAGSEAASSIRVIKLKRNRGKGGAVTHGMRHIRGRYAVFADADGASKFEDLGKLVRECQKIEDTDGRAVAVGSRAHLVGSEAVVKVRCSPIHFLAALSKISQRSFLRNFLMHSFHLLLRILTPPATAAIRDTQCGFKLFSRASLPYIIPYMHCEGWIFDVEMLMLAEAASIPVAEVPIGWHEVTGSKLNVIRDSLYMAWSLAVLRAAWGLGVYKRS